MAVRTQRFRLSMGRTVGLMAGLLLAGSSCSDPVRAQAIDALGGENSSVRPGPLHRPGQPCMLCHSDEGGEAPFAFAGTVYLDAMSNTPVGNVDVTVMDAKGKSFTATSNCAGNFFATAGQFTPSYPIYVSMTAGMVFRSMDTASFREGSCAACHSDPKGRSSAGHVYLIDDPTAEMPPPSNCK